MLHRADDAAAARLAALLGIDMAPHLKQVQEVGGDAQVELQHHGLVEVARQLQVLVQPLADEAVAHQRHAVGLQRVAHRVAQQVDRVEVLQRAGR